MIEMCCHLKKILCSFVISGKTIKVSHLSKFNQTSDMLFVKVHLRAPLTYLGYSAELYISQSRRTKKIGQCQLFTKKTISSIL